MKKFVLLTAAVAATLQAADSGMSTEQLAKIPVRMKAFVDQKRIAGAVTLVARHGKVVEFDAVGMRDIEAGKPMTKDSIFQIMSMTKPFVGVAIMMLVDEGKVVISDPVEKYLPEFRGQMVADVKDGVKTIRKPSRLITVRDCMTHTSGLSYGPFPGFAELNQKMDKSLAEAMLIYSQQPLEFEPGSKWQYSNVGIAVLGRIIEVSSGQSFEGFIASRIFDPLGMKDSHFFLPAEKQGRLAPVYRLVDGKLAKADGTILGGDPMKFRPGAKYPAPEWGLYTTASDLLQFYQMMLSGGKSGGKQLLSKASVEMMTSMHTADLRSGHMPGTAFGLTWEVVRPEGMGELHLLSAGTFGHGGAFNTHGWIDKKKDLIGIFLIQNAVGTGDVKYAFMGMANAAVMD